MLGLLRVATSLEQNGGVKCLPGEKGKEVKGPRRGNTVNLSWISKEVRAPKR